MATANPLAKHTIVLQPGQRVTHAVQPGQHYQVRRSDSPDKPEDLQVPDNLIATRQGDALQVRYADGSSVKFEDFFSTCKDDSICSVNLASDDAAGITLAGDMPLGHVMASGEGTLAYAHGSHDVLLAMAEGQTQVLSTLNGLGDFPTLTYLAESDHGIAIFTGLAGVLIANAWCREGRDSTPPTVTKVALGNATGALNNTLNAGDALTVTVTMSEATTVSGNPTLALHIGGSTVQAQYVSGSGSTALVFSYTILPGQNDANGISIDANSLAVNGGTLTDATGNAAVLSHAALPDNTNYLVDTLAPTVTISSNVGAVKVGETATITFSFSEDPGSTFTAADVTTTNGTLGPISGSDLTRTATFTPTANLASGNASITVAAGNYTDAAGNNGGAGATPVISMDTLAPAVTNVALSGSSGALNSTLNAGDTLTLTVTLSQATTVSGTPTLALNIGGSTVLATYLSGSGSTSLVFGYTILAGENDANGISIDANSLALASGSLKDAVGNNAVLTHSAVADNAGFLVDTLAQTTTIDSYTDDAGTGGTFASGSITDDATPVLNGTLSAGIGSAGVVQIFEGATLLGNATVSGTSWTFATPTLADGSQHSYTAVATDAAGNQGAASSAFTLTVSTPFERLVNADITGSAAGWTLTTIPFGTYYVNNGIAFNGSDTPAGGSTYQILTNLLVGQSYTVQYELGEVQVISSHTLVTTVQDGAVWNAGTQLASQSFIQTSGVTTLHSFTFTPTSSTATLVFTNTAVFNTVNSDISVNQASVMLTDEAARHAATPLILDLNGDGVQTTTVAQGVLFDVAHTGVPTQSAWVSPTDGLLVRDINQDGIINNGSELFGQGTLLSDGSHAANGFAALAQFDANHDGTMDAQDAVFKNLLVWRDANGDGVSQASELHGLGELGIVSIKLSATTGYAAEHGNLHGLLASYTTSDGVLHALDDVWLQQQASTASLVI